MLLGSTLELELDLVTSSGMPRIGTLGTLVCSMQADRCWPQEPAGPALLLRLLLQLSRLERKERTRAEATGR
jgi:hypothetical protein